MSTQEPPSLHQATIDAITSYAGRATLGFQRANRPGPYGTLFWFNELLESTEEADTVRPLLLTAVEQTRYEVAELAPRPEMCDPGPSAERSLITQFAQGWTELAGLGVAVQSTAFLDAYAADRGWSWKTDEITDGVAARTEDIDRITAEPVTAYALGHDVARRTGAREQAVVVGALARMQDGTIRWSTELPTGCVGAPVFYSAPDDDEEGPDSFKLVCAGVLLPADNKGFGHHPVATFDRIREALSALPVLEPSPSTRGRRWWHRRK
ncbi:hypothetical protein [Streptomyces sp. NK08204]|uniref:hypothetical protein n=1 Tax=Streptomyces sp. NK08204 TaxID=2873260 RepID=UPI001CECA852|nr:hypothetical protein [Streptomyces sp. NK08204]